MSNITQIDKKQEEDKKVDKKQEEDRKCDYCNSSTKIFTNLKLQKYDLICKNKLVSKFDFITHSDRAVKCHDFEINEIKKEIFHNKKEIKINKKFKKKKILKKLYCPQCKKETSYREIGFRIAQQGLKSFRKCLFCGKFIETSISYEKLSTKNTTLETITKTTVNSELNIVNLSKDLIKSLFTYRKLEKEINKRLKKHGINPAELKKEFEEKYGSLD